MNILLIDDDKDPRFERNMRFMIENHFRKRGIRLYFASTLGEGLAMVKQDRTIKLVLCDLSMPCSPEPQETIDNWIPKFRSYAHVAAFTGFDEDDLRRKAMAGGAIGFISKAETPEEQLAEIDEIVRQIAGAHIRMETEEQEVATRRGSKYALPVVVSIIGGIALILGTAGGWASGFMKGAEERGADKQQLNDWRASTTKKLEDHDLDIAKIKNSMRRVEMGNRLLLQHAGIQPPRDDE